MKHLSPSRGPQLVISRQNSQVVEKVSKNGIQERVHVVVKNQPFLMQLGITDYDSKEPLSGMSINAQLLYDSPEMKEVKSVKLKPLECKFLESEQLDSLTAEVKLKVLTSQMEGLNFRVVFTLPGLNLRAVSESIRVVSKPEQCRPRKAQRSKGLRASPLSIPEVLGPALERIHLGAERNSLSLQQLADSHAEAMNDAASQSDSDANQTKTPVGHSRVNSSPSGYSPSGHANNHEIAGQSEPSKEKDLSEFEKAFAVFAKAFHNLSHEEKAERVRRLVHNSTSRDLDSLTEIVQSLRGTLQVKQSFSTTASQPSHLASGCSCPNCPHRNQLEQLDCMFSEYNSPF